MQKTKSNHANLYQNTVTTIASVGIEKIGSSTISNLITPAVWTLNYAKTGAKPSVVDGGIYATGFVNAPAGIVAGTIKAYMDDDIAKKTRDIALRQEQKYRKFIHPVQDYSYQPPFIAAMTIAQNGGTVWLGKNGQWVYITGARGALVIDYKPKNSIKFMQPVFPLVKKEDGKFMYSVFKGDK
jgi:hypothetical protein